MAGVGVTGDLIRISSLHRMHLNRSTAVDLLVPRSPSPTGPFRVSEGCTGSASASATTPCPPPSHAPLCVAMLSRHLMVTPGTHRPLTAVLVLALRRSA